MAKAKVQAEAVAEEAPEVAPKAASGLTDAQQYKLDTQKAKAKAEADKRAAVIAKVKEDAEAFKPEIRGSWIGYAEKSGVISPALVIAEKFVGEGEGLKLVLTLMVFSPATAQPYRAELTY